MNKWNIKSLRGRGTLAIDRKDGDKLSLRIGDEEVIILTEDLATVIGEELPKDRANDLFSEVVEKEISSGMARVVVEAKSDIKAGDKVCFKININKYIGTTGQSGVRVSPNGIIY